MAQPWTNFGSLVNRRTANRTKKKEMDFSAKLGKGQKKAVNIEISNPAKMYLFYSNMNDMMV